MNEYTYTGYYFDIIVKEELDNEGVLSGDYGKLHYIRCSDGFSIIDSCFLGSGFVSYPTSVDLGFPGTINGIPVTEIHQKVSLDSALPIAIEGRNLKRVYLRLSKSTLDDQLNNSNNGFATLLLYIIRDQQCANQSNKFTEVSIDFCNEMNSVDYCEIECDDKLLLHGISANHLKIISSTTVLLGSAYSGLEKAEFSGKVYPYIDSDWDGEWPHIDFFAGSQHLKMVDGSLRGDECWSFKDCTSLESTHLSNGILKVPSRSFENCSSLVDLYIPDTVTEIGEYAFAGCTKLKTIHLPSNIMKIPKGVFLYCESLTKVFLSDNIEIIEDEAFKGCTNLRKPWIPKNIKSISESAFDNPDWCKITDFGT